MTSPSRTPALSAYAPYSTPDVADTAWWVALASSLGLERVWFGQQSFAPVVAGAGYAAGRGHRAAIGSAVSLIPTTTPFAAAQELRSLVQLTGRRACGYFSPGYPEIQRRMTGRAWSSPLTATRDFVTAVRALVAGAPAEVRGDEVHTVHHATGVDASADCEIGLGVLRPGMARLAGEIADGLVTWLASPDYLADVLVSGARSAAAAAGRGAPRVVATLHAAPSTADADIPAAVHRAVGAHLRAPHYRDMLSRGGLDLPPEPGDRDLRRVAGAGLVCTGGPDEILARARALGESGADEVAVVLHAPPGADRSRLREQWTGLARHASEAALTERTAS